MAGYDRRIDPITRDYVDDGAGTFETTRTAETAIYHQVRTPLGSWWGDPEAGSRLHELEQAKNPVTSPIVIDDMLSGALARLVDEGRISEPEILVERDVDEVVAAVTVRDLWSGETLDLTNLVPVNP